MKTAYLVGVIIVLVLLAGLYLTQQNATAELKTSFEITDADSSTNGLAISCPGGVVCNEDYIYRAFEYRDNDRWIYINFKPQVVNNYGLDSFKNNFNYLNLKIEFPELSNSTTEAYYQNKEPIREIKFTSYENGKLRGEIKTSVRNITLRNRSQECNLLDIQLPDHCYAEMPVNQELKIVFDLTVAR
jgi:hypothetical protein